jgi:L-fuculose-phosphate aldolase
MYSAEFERIGKRLFAEHLVGGNFGNVSIRSGKEGFFIKRSGTYLDVATEPVFISLKGDAPPGASSEYRVHLEIFRQTGYEAIVHAHPPHAIAASFGIDEIIPQDSEGKMFCPVIPIVQGAPGSQDLAENVTRAILSSKLVIVRGHGTFAAGMTLDEAFVYTSLAEHSCRILRLKRSLSS